MQEQFELAKAWGSLHDVDLDAVTYQAMFSRRRLNGIVWTAILVDIPKICLSAYVLVTLVVRGRAGPFYRTLCFEVSPYDVSTCLKRNAVNPDVINK